MRGVTVHLNEKEGELLGGEDLPSNPCAISVQPQSHRLLPEYKQHVVSNTFRTLTSLHLTLKNDWNSGGVFLRNKGLRRQEIVRGWAWGRGQRVLGRRRMPYSISAENLKIMRNYVDGGYNWIEEKCESLTSKSGERRWNLILPLHLQIQRAPLETRHAAIKGAVWAEVCRQI